MPSFGEALKTNEDYIEEVYSLVDKRFPFTIQVVNGKIAQFSYETEWKEGETTPIVDEHGEIDYEENYTIMELTQSEQNIINAWAQTNVEGVNNA